MWQLKDIIFYFNICGNFVLYLYKFIITQCQFRIISHSLFFLDQCKYFNKIIMLNNLVTSLIDQKKLLIPFCVSFIYDVIHNYNYIRNCHNIKRRNSKKWKDGSNFFPSFPSKVIAPFIVMFVQKQPREIMRSKKVFSISYSRLFLLSVYFSWSRVKNPEPWQVIGPNHRVKVSQQVPVFERN